MNELYIPRLFLFFLARIRGCVNFAQYKFFYCIREALENAVAVRMRNIIAGIGMVTESGPLDLASLHIVSQVTTEAFVKGSRKS